MAGQAPNSSHLALYRKCMLTWVIRGFLAWVTGWGDIVITEARHRKKSRCSGEEQEVRWGHGDPEVPMGLKGRSPASSWV